MSSYNKSFKDINNFLFLSVFLMILLLHLIAINFKIKSFINKHKIAECHKSISLKKIVLIESNTINNPKLISKNKKENIVFEEKVIEKKLEGNKNIVPIMNIKKNNVKNEVPDTVNTSINTNIKNDITEKLINDYLDLLNKEITSHIRYPRNAKQKNLEGVVEIKFVINKKGVIKKSEIVKTSGHKILDKSVLKAVDKIKKIMPIPSELNIDEVNGVIPIHFELE